VNRTRRVQRDFTARFMADLLASGLVGGGARAGFLGSPRSGGLCPGCGKVWTAPVSGLLAVGMGFVTRWFQGGVSGGPYGYTRNRPAAEALGAGEMLLDIAPTSLQHPGNQPDTNWTTLTLTDLLPVDYDHVVFTLPAPIGGLA